MTDAPMVSWYCGVMESPLWPNNKETKIVDLVMNGSEWHACLFIFHLSANSIGLYAKMPWWQVWWLFRALGEYWTRWQQRQYWVLLVPSSEVPSRHLVPYGLFWRTSLLWGGEQGKVIALIVISENLGEDDSFLIAMPLSTPSPMNLLILIKSLIHHYILIEISTPSRIKELICW